MSDFLNKFLAGEITATQLKHAIKQYENENEIIAHEQEIQKLKKQTKLQQKQIKELREVRGYDKNNALHVASKLSEDKKQLDKKIKVEEKTINNLIKKRNKIHPKIEYIDFDDDSLIKNNKFTGYITIKATFVEKNNNEYKIEKELKLPFVKKVSRQDILDASIIKINEFIDILDGDYICESATIYLSKTEKIKKQKYLFVDESKKSKTKIKDMDLKENKFMKLPYNIESNNTIFENNCFNDSVLAFLSYDKERYAKAIRELQANIKKVRTVEECINFLDSYKISYIIFRYDLKIYKKNKFDKKKLLMAIIHNEHFQIITKKEKMILKEEGYDYEINNIIYKDNLHEFVTQACYDISMPIKYSVGLSLKNKNDNNYYFRRALINKILYVDDELLIETYKIYKEIFGENVPIKYNFKCYSPFIFIAKNNKLYSRFADFLPKPKGVKFSNSKYNFHPNLISIDKNKDYPYHLMMLDYLPIIDATCKFMDMEVDHKFDKNNFYHIKRILRKDIMTTSTLGVFEVGWMTGHRLHGYESYFVIDTYLTPILVQNPFKNIIPNFFDKDTTETKCLMKDALNKFIGFMQIRNQHESIQVAGRLFNNTNEMEILTDDEKDSIVKMPGNLYTTINNFMNKNKFEKSMIPIAYYILDSAAHSILDKVVEINKIFNDDVNIVKCNVDSISFFTTKKYPKDIIIKKLNLSYELDAWKLEKNKPSINSYGNSKEVFLKRHRIPELQEIQLSDIAFYLNQNILIDSYAGCGKTTSILTKIIPLLPKEEKLLILCSAHQPLEPYYQRKYDARVISTFYLKEAQRLLKTYDRIIVEEDGLLNPHDFHILYDNITIYQKIIFIGDSGQLRPIGSFKIDPPIGNQLITQIFNKRIMLTTNYRNNYTIEEYDQMKNLTYQITDFERQIIGRITNFNICFFNNTRNKINNFIVKDWKDTFEGLKVKVGGQLVCKANFHKQGIYNNMKFEIVSYTNDLLVLKSRLGDIFNITKDMMHFTKSKYNKKNKRKLSFDYGYCYTLYGLQGDEEMYDKIGIHDWNHISQDGRAMYVAFSRIKLDMKKKE